MIEELIAKLKFALLHAHPSLRYTYVGDGEYSTAACMRDYVISLQCHSPNCKFTNIVVSSFLAILQNLMRVKFFRYTVCVLVCGINVY